MAANTAQEGPKVALKRARSLISEAMDLLDACGASRPAAAHLALALEELREQPTTREEQAGDG